MIQHTVKAFDADIGELRGLIAQMGGLAEDAIRRSMRALTGGDPALADAVCADDARIDALEEQVETLAVQIIALRAPLANDLREVVAALKIAGAIERIGDYAKNIARRAREVNADPDADRIEPLSVLPAMARLAAEMVHDVLDAFAARDPALASDVRERDRALDDFYDSIFRLLMTFMVENPRTVGQVAHLLFVAKNLERIGDHATNVAEMVHFAATGARASDRAPNRES